MLRAAVIALVVSCGHGVETPRAPVADGEVVRQVQQLDYRAPARDVRRELRMRAAELYRRACEARESAADCAWALSLSVDELPLLDEPARARVAAIAEVLVRRCAAGEPGACRAFHSRAARLLPVFADAAAACDRGIAVACARVSREERACDLGDPAACATDELRRRAAHAGCARGYGDSCDRRGDDGAVNEHAIDGCARGYLDECALTTGRRDLTLRNLERICAITGRACTQQLYVELLADRGVAASRRALATCADDRFCLRVRDALEHGCQFRDADACAQLVELYRNGLPEPVPGRRQELAVYLATRRH